MRRLSEASERLEGQPMFSILAKANELEKKGRNIIHLELGDPDFDSPRNAIEAAYDSLNRGETHYTGSYGLSDLREEVVNFIEKNKKFKPDLSQTLITPGANIQIYYAVACTTNPGEEVIVPDPGFVSYFSIIDFLGVKPVRIPLYEENNFRLNPQDLEKAITDKTRMIIVNSPSNPTGAVINSKEMEEIYGLAKRHDLFLLTDEVYGNMIYGNQDFKSPSTFDECKERTILMDSLSKRYSMTGWRLGFMVAPEKLNDKMRLLLETTSSCVSPFIQRAAIEVIKNSEKRAEEITREFEKRKNFLVRGLNTIEGVSCLEPGGAFYAFPNIKRTGMSSREFADFMLEKAGIALAPGDIFGKYGEGYVRISYTVSPEKIEEAVSRMKSALAEKLLV